jgi:hypothetical protein
MLGTSNWLMLSRCGTGVIWVLSFNWAHTKAEPAGRPGQCVFACALTFVQACLSFCGEQLAADQGAANSTAAFPNFQLPLVTQK